MGPTPLVSGFRSMSSPPDTYIRKGTVWEVWRAATRGVKEGGREGERGVCVCCLCVLCVVCVLLHLKTTHNLFAEHLGLRYLILEAVHWYGPHHHTYKHWTRKLFRVQRSPECPKREPRAYFNSNSNSINLLAIPYNPSTAQMSPWSYAVGTFHTQQPSADSVCAW